MTRNWCASTADMLVDLGYDVEASSAGAALRTIDDGAPIDLLITDRLHAGNERNRSCQSGSGATC